MKVTSLGAVVLTGQGGGGSYGVGVPNPAPGLGTMAGENGNDQVVVPITNPGSADFSSEAVEALPSHLSPGIPPAPTPAPAVAMADGAPSHEPTSQYSTIGPVPKG